MATVKTAISVQNELLAEANRLAEELRISRSRLVALALEAFIERHRNREILRAINKTYEHGLDATEEKVLRDMDSHRRQLVETDKW